MSWLNMFGKSKKSGSRDHQSHSARRRMTLESLESRQLLAVTGLPEANTDVYSVSAGQDVMLEVGSIYGVLANDNVADGSAKEAVPVMDGETNQNGTFAIGDNGAFVYHPADGFIGIDTFTYTLNEVDPLTDDVLGSSTGTVVVSVQEGYQPIANTDIYTTTVNTTKTVDNANGVLANDTSPNDLELKVMQKYVVEVDAGGNPIIDPITLLPIPKSIKTAHGTVQFKMDTWAADGYGSGSFVYTPDANFIGIDTFVYQSTDFERNSNLGIVVMVVDGTDPTINIDTYTTKNTQTLEITDAQYGLLANDSSSVSQVLTVTGSGTTVNGGTWAITDSAKGLFTYTPAVGFIGVDSFNYIVLSNGVEFGVGTAIIDVTGAMAPIANTDVFTTNENEKLTVGASGVLANDISISGLPLDVATGSKGTYVTTNGGTVVIGDNGAIEYTPAEGFYGVDTWSYKAADVKESVQETESNEAQIVFVVKEVIDPTAVTDHYQMVAGDGATLTIDAAQGILVNDLNVTTATTVTPKFVGTFDTIKGGSVIIAADGSFVYTPKAGFVGTDMFFYSAEGQGGSSNIATVLIDVISSTEYRPEAISDLYSVIKGNALTVADAAFGVVKNDISKAGLALSVVVNDTTNNVYTTTSKEGATVTINPDGTFTYTPAASSTFIGLDTFTYQVQDSAGNKSDSATVAVNVISQSDVAPIVNTDYYSVITGNTLAQDAGRNLISNDTSLTSGVLTAVAETTTSVNGGTVTIYADGTFVYTPAAGFVGTDMFGYTVSDGLFSSKGVAVVTVLDLSSIKPIAESDVYATTKNEQLVVGDSTATTNQGVLTNDLSPTGLPLQAIAVTEVATLAGGKITIYANGSLVYTPKMGFTGMDSFLYQVTDGTWTSEGLIVISVNAPVLPVANNDIFGTMENTAIPSMNVLKNDLSPSGEKLSINAVDTATYNTQGTVTINADNTLNYTPKMGFVGIDTFAYQIIDESGNTSWAMVTVNVSARIKVTTLEDKYSVSCGGILVVGATYGILSNDVAIDGTLGVQWNSSPRYGTLTLNADGSFTYAANVGFTGTDTFYYRAVDTAGNYSINTLVTITVSYQEGISANDSYRTMINETLTTVDPSDPSYDAQKDQASVLANDSYPNGTAQNPNGSKIELEAVLISGPVHGTLTLNADGTFIYTPEAGYAGVDNFTYRAKTTRRDGTVEFGNLAQATITVLQDCPELTDTTVYWTDWQDTDLFMDNSDHTLVDNWDVPSGKTLTVVTKGNGSTTYTTKEGGTVTVYSNGVFEYLPPDGFIGWDSFDYKVTDGVCTVDATARIVVNPVIYVACGGVTISQNDDNIEVIDAKRHSMLNENLHNITALKVISTYRNTTFTINTDGCYKSTGSNIWLADGIYLESQAAGRSTDKLVINGSANADNFILSNDDLETANGDMVSDVFNKGIVNGFTGLNGTLVFTNNLEEATLSGRYGNDTYYVEGLMSQITKTTVDSGKNEDTLDFSEASEGVNINIGKSSAQRVFASSGNKLIS
ncbi:MAG: Ig-like domain-containing protein, partial [Thermoguttaceae bacterium]|nr:Ig-like domain-containing protein [Thermoguttaceae bacterium]